MNNRRSLALFVLSTVWALTWSCEQNDGCAPAVLADAGGGAESLDAGGQGGAGGLAGDEGIAGAPECPASIVVLDGEDCSVFGEGFECSDGGTNPCEFGNAIVCVDGKWERRESYPAPCGGASGFGPGP